MNCGVGLRRSPPFRCKPSSLSAENLLSASTKLSNQRTDQLSKFTNRNHGKEEREDLAGSCCPSCNRDSRAQIALRCVANLITYHNITSTKFTDPQFKIGAVESQVFLGNGNSTCVINGGDSVIWRRPAEGEWTIIKDDVRPDDVQQGRVGDCWFITALAVAAERPSLIHKLLLTDEVNKVGAYCVRLCKDGRWTSVVVDDILPVSRRSGNVLCSRGRRHQLWVCLLEKALAKLCGGYQGIVAGRCAEGLALVTGATCVSIALGSTENREDKENMNEDVAWNLLTDAFNRKFLMCAMCSNSSLSESEFISRGLIHNHAYSIRCFSQDAMHGRRIILMNPWKPREPISMSFKDFVIFFDSADICRVRDILSENYDQSFTNQPNIDSHCISKNENSWLTRRLFGNFKENMYIVTVNKACKLDMSLFRTLGPTRNRSDGESIAIIMLKCNENNRTRFSFFQNSDRANSKSVSLIIDELKEGKYIVIPVIFSKYQSIQKPKFTLSVHYPNLANVNVVSTIPDPKLLRHALIALAVKKGNCVRLTKNIIVYDMSYKWDGIICVVQNSNDEDSVQFEVEFQALSNVVHSRSVYREGGGCILFGNSPKYIKDVIPAKSWQIVFIASRDRPRERFYVKHKYNFKIMKGFSANIINHQPCLCDKDTLHNPILFSSCTVCI
ncbi:hypothetical protein GJ496_002701 [Pomphorhynchus laevis]|nr:hypothetical protein GJ496_002701 [Pomphorhynchus laevis]